MGRREVSRHYEDWLTAYVEHASYTEAPKRMHFWSGVSSIAGALRRRCWLDLKFFKWTPCFYIVIVAPPGVVSKSTTTAISLDLLRKVPGIKFGPQIVTWPALVKAFAESHEEFEYGGEYHAQCALTLESSEFGNLVNPADREMIDLLVTLWDSKQGGLSKVTKGSGKDDVVNPWINLIACTTPAWIEGNFPEYVIGGGFTSRCLFVYADKKEKRVAYPDEGVPDNMDEIANKLVQDLEHISQAVVGPFKITKEGRAWGRKWYDLHYDSPPEQLTDDRFSGYLARKQTHMHKLAMVLSASRGDSMEITEVDLSIAFQMLNSLEEDMPKVFARIGRTEESINAERFIKYVQTQGSVSYEVAYHFIHTYFPKFRDFETMLAGAVRSGQIVMVASGTGYTLKAAKPK